MKVFLCVSSRCAGNRRSTARQHPVSSGILREHGPGHFVSQHFSHHVVFFTTVSRTHVTADSDQRCRHPGVWSLGFCVWNVFINNANNYTISTRTHSWSCYKFNFGLNSLHWLVSRVTSSRFCSASVLSTNDVAFPISQRP